MSDDGASDWDDELERLEDLVNEGQHVFDGNVKDAKEVDEWVKEIQTPA